MALKVKMIDLFADSYRMSRIFDIKSSFHSCTKNTASITFVCMCMCMLAGVVWQEILLTALARHVDYRSNKSDAFVVKTQGTVISKELLCTVCIGGDMYLSLGGRMLAVCWSLLSVICVFSLSTGSWSIVMWLNTELYHERLCISYYVLQKFLAFIIHSCHILLKIRCFFSRFFVICVFLWPTHVSACIEWVSQFKLHDSGNW